MHYIAECSKQNDNLNLSTAEYGVFHLSDNYSLVKYDPESENTKGACKRAVHRFTAHKPFSLLT